MDLYFSIPSRQLVSLNGGEATLHGVRKGGDTVNLRFLDAGSNVVELPDPDTNLVISLGIKLTSTLYGAGFLTSVSGFTKTGSGITTVYTAGISYNTTQIDAAFTNNTLESVGVKAEVDFRYGGAIPTKSLPLNGGVIYNAIIVGDEPEPTDGSPAIPVFEALKILGSDALGYVWRSAAQMLAYLGLTGISTATTVGWSSTVVTLTGGGATSLDGTNGVTDGTTVFTADRLFIINPTGLGGQGWVLTAGTDAANGTTIIHPANYNVSTFAFVFKRLF